MCRVGHIKASAYWARHHQVYIKYQVLAYQKGCFWWTWVRKFVGHRSSACESWVSCYFVRFFAVENCVDHPFQFVTLRYVTRRHASISTFLMARLLHVARTIGLHASFIFYLRDEESLTGLSSFCRRQLGMMRSFTLRYARWEIPSIFTILDLCSLSYSQDGL